MADLPEVNEWPVGIYQLETSDPVLGGPEGIDNLQGKQLASRTKWLRDQLERISNGLTAVGQASKLATARALSFKGAATGTGSFDGSADIEITLALANSGVVAGTWPKVTVNSKGLVTGGSALEASDLPVGVTAPQFDKGLSYATAEFVQRALGSMRGSFGLTASKDLTVADVGKRIELAPGVSITLPPSSTVPAGATLLISTQAAATAQVGVVAGDVLSMCNIPVPTPRQLSANSDFLVVCEGNVWRAHLGTETLRTSSLFAASLTPNGRQVNPSGLLFQWVTGNSDVNGTLNLTLPVTFPNEILGGLAGEANPGGWGVTSATVWGFHQGASTRSTAVAQVRVIAGTAGPQPAVATGRILVWGR
ncbi:gp53-like domain-containing protein [Pseudomonas chlororaphis]|uniref:gp53-like domain-containing protein n=1 Tax=Pseudomonas chlororaphis TaxID=587753 RepID=UPI0011863FF9|nr:hypothetical protein [Pseudomonas chlororaphis]